MSDVEVPLPGGSHSVVVRVGSTVRRMRRASSGVVLELLAHLEAAGFTGAPRALGFDEQGREVLSYVEGEVGFGADFIAEGGGRFDRHVPDFVWSDEALVRVGSMMREFHDAAATFPGAGREWMFEPRSPAETICHHEAFPSNTVFRSGLPVAFIDWDTAGPGPRIWDLGMSAWRWVPFVRDEKARAMGRPTGVTEKARRFRLFVEAYGMEPDLAIVQAGIERSREFLGQIRSLLAEGYEFEIEPERRGLLDEIALEIAWVEANAEALAAG